MSNPTVWVPTPIRPARRGGIFTAAQIIDVDERLDAAATVQYQSLPCGPAHTFAAACWGDGTGDTTKTPDGIAIGTSAVVGTSYFGIECFLNGDEDYNALAEAGLAGVEGQAIEARINQLFQNTTFTNYTAFATAAAHGNDAIAGADQYLDLHSNGLGVIYGGRNTAVLRGASFGLFGDGIGNIATINGTPFVASAQFTTPAGKLSPGIWMSGPVIIWRGPVAVNRGYDLTHNRELAIAERQYAVGFDCLNPVYVPFTEA